MPLARNRNQGFTLMELMIVVALVAIIATVAVPGFGRLVESNRVSGYANTVVGAMSYARAEAVRAGARIDVQASTSGGATVWGNGFRIERGGVLLREIEAAPTGVTFERNDSNGVTFSFRSTGELVNNNENLEFSICGDVTRREVLVEVLGGGLVRATAGNDC